MYIVFKLAYVIYSERYDMCSKCDKQRKLSELAFIIRGVSYSGISYAGEKKTETKSASSAERQFKLKELARLIRGV